MSIVFGPVISRRFGISLGVDLSVEEKQCNFNCVYCELEAKKAQDYQTKITPLNNILDQIRSALERDSKIDVLTFSANGEPTLYPNLKELIESSREILSAYPHIKTLILSNGSRFKESREALMLFDMVKFSLDSIHPLTFKRVDKPSKSLNLDSMLRGIREFASEFKGDLIAEILIVSGINDAEEYLKESADFLREINVKRLDISSIDRPSSHNVLPVSTDRLYEIANIFEGISVNVATRKDIKTNILKKDYDRDELLLLIKRRPLSVEDAGMLLTQHSMSNLKSLIDQKLVIKRNVSGVEFYYLA